MAENVPPKTKSKTRYIPNKRGTDQLFDEQNNACYYLVHREGYLMYFYFDGSLLQGQKGVRIVLHTYQVPIMLMVLPQKTCFTTKNMLVRSARTGPPAPARKLALAGTPAQPRFAPLQEKKYPARRLGGPRTR